MRSPPSESEWPSSAATIGSDSSHRDIEGFAARAIGALSIGDGRSTPVALPGFANEMLICVLRLCETGTSVLANETNDFERPARSESVGDATPPHRRQRTSQPDIGATSPTGYSAALDLFPVHHRSRLSNVPAFSCERQREAEGRPQALVSCNALLGGVVASTASYRGRSQAIPRMSGL